MRSVLRAHTRPVRRAVFMLAATVLVAACASTPPATIPATPVAASASSATASPDPDATAPASAATSDAPALTPVPGGETVGPGPEGTPVGTTQTDWGTILDDLPATFPMFPDAGVADAEGGPFSGTFDVPVDTDTAAGWYRDELTDRGYGIELSDPLEDGGRVLDAQADLPECRIQMTFRPTAESTIITVLVAAACATGTEG